MPLEIIFLWGVRAENFIKKRKKKSKEIVSLGLVGEGGGIKDRGGGLPQFKTTGTHVGAIVPDKDANFNPMPPLEIGGGGGIFKICSIFLSHYLG